MESARSLHVRSPPSFESRLGVRMVDAVARRHVQSRPPSQRPRCPARWTRGRISYSQKRPSASGLRVMDDLAGEIPRREIRSSTHDELACCPQPRTHASAGAACWRVTVWFFDLPAGAAALTCALTSTSTVLGYDRWFASNAPNRAVARGPPGGRNAAGSPRAVCRRLKFHGRTCASRF